jgi:hypothetical protein
MIESLFERQDFLFKMETLSLSLCGAIYDLLSVKQSKIHKTHPTQSFNASISVQTTMPWDNPGKCKIYLSG